MKEMGEKMKVGIEVPEGRAPYALSTVPIPDGWEWRGEFRRPEVGEAFANYAGVGFVERSPGFFHPPAAILYRKLQPKPGEVWEVVWNGGSKAQYLVTALNGSYVALRLDGRGITASGRREAAEDLFSEPFYGVAQRVDPPPKSVPPSDTWVPPGFEWRGEVRVPQLRECYYSTLARAKPSAVWAHTQHTTAAFPILHIAPKLGDIWLHGSGSRFLITCYANRYAALDMDGSGGTLNGWKDDIADVLPTTIPIFLDNRPAA